MQALYLAILSLCGSIIVAIVTVITQLQIAKGDFIIKEKESKDKFRFSALDKRLDKHQEAYSLWEKMRLHAHSSDENVDKNAMLTHCRQWWEDNCLYLTEQSSARFAQCIVSVGSYRLYTIMLRDARQKKENNIEELHNELMKSWDFIMGTGKLITEEVGHTFFDYEAVDKKLK
jgi:hypothetical protein